MNKLAGLHVPTNTSFFIYLTLSAQMHTERRERGLPGLQQTTFYFFGLTCTHTQVDYYTQEYQKTQHYFFGLTCTHTGRLLHTQERED